MQNILLWEIGLSRERNSASVESHDSTLPDRGKEGGTVMSEDSLCRLMFREWVRPYRASICGCRQREIR